MPTLSVPEITVTFSRCGCVCGGNLNPSGILTRTVKSPVEADGSPSSTDICAPGGTDGGAGPHFTWSDVKAVCATNGCAAKDAATERTSRRNGIFIEPSPMPRHDKQSPPQPQASAARLSRPQ